MNYLIKPEFVFNGIYINVLNNFFKIFNNFFFFLKKNNTNLNFFNYNYFYKFIWKKKLFNNPKFFYFSMGNFFYKKFFFKIYKNNTLLDFNFFFYNYSIYSIKSNKNFIFKNKINFFFYFILNPKTMFFIKFILNSKMIFFLKFILNSKMIFFLKFILENFRNFFFYQKNYFITNCKFNLNIRANFNSNLLTLNSVLV